MADRGRQQNNGKQNIFVEIIWTLILVHKTILSAICRTIFGVAQKSVRGQKILITGAGSGLGRLMALDFAERGAEIIAWDINTAGNEATAKMIRDKKGKVSTYTADIR